MPITDNYESIFDQSNHKSLHSTKSNFAKNDSKMKTSKSFQDLKIKSKINTNYINSTRRKIFNLTKLNLNSIKNGDHINNINYGDNHDNQDNQQRKSFLRQTTKMSNFLVKTAFNLNDVKKIIDYEEKPSQILTTNRSNNSKTSRTSNARSKLFENYFSA